MFRNSLQINCVFVRTILHFSKPITKGMALSTVRCGPRPTMTYNGVCLQYGGSFGNYAASKFVEWHTKYGKQLGARCHRKKYHGGKALARTQTPMVLIVTYRHYHRNFILNFYAPKRMDNFSRRLHRFASCGPVRSFVLFFPAIAGGGERTRFWILFYGAAMFFFLLRFSRDQQMSTFNVDVDAPSSSSTTSFYWFFFYFFSRLFIDLQILTKPELFIFSFSLVHTGCCGVCCGCSPVNRPKFNVTIKMHLKRTHTQRKRSCWLLLVGWQCCRHNTE